VGVGIGVRVSQFERDADVQIDTLVALLLEVDVAAEVDGDAQGVEHGGLGAEGGDGVVRGGGVGDVEVVGAVAGHELIAGDAVHLCVP